MNTAANDTWDSTPSLEMASYGQQLVPMLCRALSVGNDHARIGTALLLARIGARDAVLDLIEAFKTDSAQVGAAVAFALGSLRDPRALPILMLAARKDFVAAHACEAMGAIGHSDALPAIAECAKRHCEQTKVAVARALGRLSYASSEQLAIANELLSELLESPVRQVRLHAAISLSRIAHN